MASITSKIIGADTSDPPKRSSKTTLASPGGVINGDRNCARWLGCSRMHVVKMRKEQGLPHFKFGRLVMFRVSDLQEYMDNRLVGSGQ
jgi:excisionase family DNA binding protein